MSPNTPLLLTPAQARAELGCSHATLYRALAKGELPAVKLGRATRIPRDAITAFIEKLPAAHFRAPAE